MLRSMIHKNIQEALGLLKENMIYLPPFAYWTLKDWQSHDCIDDLKTLMLGWDVTDFGQNDFYRLGGTLFTLRNGLLSDGDLGTPYAEKLIVLKDGQRLPLHYHKAKTEDIINKSAGLMAIKLYNVLGDGQVDYETDVEVLRDGMKSMAKAGQCIHIERGASITLKPFVYHVFWAEKGHGDLILGEVSSINDDKVDNYNAEPVSRFTSIEEDMDLVYPLCNELGEVVK